MIAEHKHFQDQQRNATSQAVKKPIKVVTSTEDHHMTRRSYQDNSARKKEQETINNTNNSNNNLNSNLNNNSNNNSTKAYFGSPVPMFGGAFPCGSPFYPGPPTPPMEDWPDREADDNNDVEFVDDERNLSSHESKRFQQQQQQQHGGPVFYPCDTPQLEDYLSASSSDDDDDEVCRLMFMTSSVANGNGSDARRNSSTNNNNNNNNSSTIVESSTNSINTRSRTSQRFGQQVQGQVTSSVRGQTAEARDQTGVQHGRVHKRFRAIDVTSVGNQRPSLNFRKMRRSSFHRKHHRLTDRLSSQIQTALSTTM